MIAQVALFLAVAADARFEVRGEIIPHSPAAVTLHAVQSPFATSTVAGNTGNFTFRDVEPGAYSLSVYVPKRGETRLTIQVGPGTAGKEGRVELKVDTTGSNLVRDREATVSARELAIPARARREYDTASKKIAARNYEAAVTHLERAVALAPRYASAWNHLGTIAYQTKRYEEAEGYFRKGIEADPEAYEPVVNLGGVLLNLGNVDEAWRFNVEAVLRRPNDALAQSQLGMTYVLLNKLDLAEKHLKEAITLDPAHFSHPQLQLAEVYLRKKDGMRAAEQLESFLRYHPDWPAAAKMREAIVKLRSYE